MADSKKNNLERMESYANKTCHGRWMSDEYIPGYVGSNCANQDSILFSRPLYTLPISLSAFAASYPSDTFDPYKRTTSMPYKDAVSSCS